MLSPAGFRRVPGYSPLLLVEVLRILEVTVERVEVDTELLCCVTVVVRVDLHNADVALVYLPAEDLTVLRKVAEARLAPCDLCHDRVVLKVLTHIRREGLWVGRELVLVGGREGDRGRKGDAGE